MKLKRDKVKRRSKGRGINEERVWMRRVFLVVLLILILSGLAFYFFPTLLMSFGERVFPGIFLAPEQRASTANSSDSSLTIWDDTDEVIGGQLVERLTICDEYCGAKIKSSELWNVFFFANYTDLSGNPIDDVQGSCRVRYDTGSGFSSYVDMKYDNGSLIWIYNKSFIFKGNHNFEVNCTSSFESIPDLSNEFTITNTKPYIIKTASGFIDFDGDTVKDTLQCVEDEGCFYDFSKNVSEDDKNDVLVYESLDGANTTLTDFSVDSNSGVLQVDVSHNDDTGLKKVELSALDSDSKRDTAILEVFIQPVNDAPEFLNLEDQSFNRSELFDYVIDVSDEEDNVPIRFNISFVSCDLAQWSTRTDCELFNESSYVVNNTNYGSEVGGRINISFVANRNDVGVYVVNFTAVDSGNPNSSISVLVNFTVKNINEAPVFTYLCDDERSAVEEELFECEINATDIDETDFLTFWSVPDWFLPVTFVPTNITTGFNASALVSFIPDDREVGNWNINVSINDTGSPLMVTSELISFFVGNIPDNVNIEDFGSITAYTSNNYSILINASDNDLLIPDKDVYNESLAFSSNVSWVFVSSQGIVPGTNITTVLVEFNPNDASSSGINQVNISVNDTTGRVDSTILVIDVVGNFPPEWDPETRTNHNLTEDVRFFWDLSENVTDPDGDVIAFSYISDTEFLNFGVDSSTGLIDFVPGDVDVGVHFVEINATDKATSSSLVFKFTVNNVNDAPLIETPLIVVNASSDTESNVEGFEDDKISISFFVVDDDLKVPFEQREFYEESFILDLDIEGPNPALFGFSQDTIINGKALYSAAFVPEKSDIGEYNVSINITDSAGESSYVEFNLTITEVQHSPVIFNLTDQATDLNGSIFYDINATDAEDGPDILGNLTYSYVFLPDGKADDIINGNESRFNTTSGLINLSFDSAEGGAYHLNVTVTDTTGRTDVDDFWIFVFDLPKILSPENVFIFNLKEGREDDLLFSANSSSGVNLSYMVFAENNLIGLEENLGDGSLVSIKTRPGFSDETYGNFGNLTLVAAIPGFEYVNASRTWRVNITHTNENVSFYRDIGDKETNVGKAITINLTEYIKDADIFDSFYNQSFTLKVLSNAENTGISSSISSDFILSLTASSLLTERIILSISDLDDEGNVISNAVSNSFEVKFTDPLKVEVPDSGDDSSGGGETPVSLKIIVPEPISEKIGNELILPIKIVNDGSISLNDVNLRSLISKDGEVRSDINVTLSRNFISTLRPGDVLDLIVTVEAVDQTGVYELSIFADSRDPSYSDSGKIIINFKEGEAFIERLVFTEEFIAENPECVELNELVEESRRLLDEGDFSSADKKMSEAINACKEVISKDSIFSKGKLSLRFQDKAFLYTFIFTVLALVIGIGYYVYRSVIFRKQLKEADKEEPEESEDYEKI